ncbi:MAG TPA: SEC59/DGK1/VTE5 family protein [Haloplasmataceae bacterium]
MLPTMNEWKGLALSYVFVGTLFLLSKLFSRMGMKREYNRKFIHVSISHWWLIAMAYFDRTFIALIPPVTFIIANIIARDLKLLEAMERKPSQNHGLVLYPLAMAFLVLFSFGIIHEPFIGAIGIFILGYGDGFAAIVGTKWGHRKIFRNKTLEGSIAMFIISFLVTFLILTLFKQPFAMISALSISIIATLIEIFSPAGHDNLLLPLMTSLFYYFVFYL